jgi:hypothetical protein
MATPSSLLRKTMLAAETLGHAWLAHLAMAADRLIYH